MKIFQVECVIFNVIILHSSKHPPRAKAAAAAASSSPLADNIILPVTEYSGKENFIIIIRG